jgi:hypothetical protein
MADDPAQAEQSPPASPPAVSTAAQLQAKLEEVRSACRDKQPRVAFDMLEEARAYCEVNCEHLDPLVRIPTSCGTDISRPVRIGAVPRLPATPPRQADARRRPSVSTAQLDSSAIPLASLFSA